LRTLVFHRKEESNRTTEDQGEALSWKTPPLLAASSNPIAEKTRIPDLFRLFRGSSSGFGTEFNL